MSDCPGVQPATTPDVGSDASEQRPAHRAEGATTVESDKTCVYTEITFLTPRGELVAAAATPRAFLTSSFASHLSNDERRVAHTGKKVCR